MVQSFSWICYGIRSKLLYPLESLKQQSKLLIIILVSLRAWDNVFMKRQTELGNETNL
ncbi:hypothetical protein C5167_006098 [Papaver somniferum]|uniref:Uncharacterized protein n=1 Tax=Papaver somniferum TaxID=3469 RepID=A0A4Y7JE35_PAPSO|nr:hypothetical protein C5167_006098 [Papaver somniferum]